MIDVTMTVGIMGIGRARRNIAEDDCTTNVGKTFGKRRNGQRSTSHLTLVLKKVGMTGIMRHEHPRPP
jgi:hypothetical protein